MSESPYADPNVAATYDRLAVPSQFEAPARDLIDMIDVRGAQAVVDIGTGTGAVAAVLRQSVDPSCRVVAVDASMAMLRLARDRSRTAVAIGRLPELPLPGDTFDAAAASFVISHVPDYNRALTEMIRICRPGGRVGITAWAAASVPIGKLWREIGGRYAALDALTQAFRAAIPWDDWFSDPHNIQRALEDAGLRAVAVHQRVYTIRMTVDDYVAMKGSSVEGSLLRDLMGDEAWKRFGNDAVRTCRQRFGEVVEYPRGVLFGIGTKASDGRFLNAVDEDAGSRTSRYPRVR